MNREKAQIYFFLGLLGLISILAFFIVRPYVVGLILAVVAAVIFSPLYKKLRKLLVFDSLSSLATMLIIFITILVPLTFFSFQIFQEVQSIYGYLNSIEGINAVAKVEAAINSQLEKYFGIAPETEGVFYFDFNTYVKEALNWVVNNFGVFISGLTRTILNGVIFAFALFYLLKHGSNIKNQIVKLSPLADKYDEEIWRRLKTVINSIIKGSVTIAVIQGILTGVGFFIFGIPNPVLWGSIAAIAALIPGLGTTVVTLPGVVYLFLNNQIFASLGLLVWAVLVVSLVDNLLYPKLVGREIKIHSFFVLLFVIGGITLFGPIGFILGPVILSMLFALVHVYSFLAEKEYSKSSGTS